MGAHDQLNGDCDCDGTDARAELAASPVGETQALIWSACDLHNLTFLTAVHFIINRTGSLRKPRKALSHEAQIRRVQAASGPTELYPRVYPNIPPSFLTFVPSKLFASRLRTQ